jgi:hypothetical protein
MGKKLTKREEDRIVEQAKAIFRRRGGEGRAKALSAARRREIARMGGLQKAANRRAQEGQS